MAIVKKISELTPKGSALANTDLLIVGVDNGTDYDLKSVTGAQILGNVVSQTITDGVTTKAPSENAVFDKLKEYDSLSSSQNSSTAIRFDKKFIHCGTDITGKFTGLTGNVTVLTGVGTLNVNTSSLLIHNDSVAPTFSSEFIKAQDSLDYKINVDNYVICTMINQNPTKVTYRIVRDVNDFSITNLVPYTGATQNVDLGEFEVKAGQISLDITPTGTATVGTTRWNDSLGISETTLNGGSVVLKNGVDLVARVVNKVTPNTTLTKANYQVVRISGAQGQRLAVNLAQANNDNNSADTLGIVCETIATNAEGFIMTMGQLENVNTTGSLQSETWVDGDVLYLSPTTAGKITNIKPTGATGHIVILGYVEYAHAVNGKIYVKVMNGWELDELHNVSISNPLDKQILSYENSTSLWKNKTVTTADVPDSLNKRYVTDANLTVIGNTSGTNTGDQTFLNARVQSVTSSSTVTPTNLNDLVIITAQAVGLTLANPTGTFTEGQALMIRIKDNGTARTIAFDTNYRAIGVTLPTTTVISKTMYLGIIYNSTDAKWDVIGYNIQA